jgi:multimeric flavodoxin WrbA
MTSKKILIVVGSPRKQGNSARLAEKVKEGAVSAGAHAEMIALHELDIQPCSACDSCQLEDEADCILEDDMRALYPKIRGADAIVIASPIYWFAVSAQTKLFIDRGFYALGGPGGWKTLANKEFAVLLVYGDSDPLSSGAINAIHAFQDAFRYIGAQKVHYLHASASQAGEINQQPAVLEQAFRIGQELASGKP